MNEKIKTLITNAWETIGFPKKYLAHTYPYCDDEKKSDTQLLDKTLSILVGDSEKTGFCLYLSGPPNTQKTTWVSHLVKRLLQHNIQMYQHNTRYISMYNLLDLRRGSSTLTTKSYYDKAKLASLQSKPILIIDDAFDINTTFISTKSDFTKTFIYNFMKHRIENGLTTVFISNIPFSDISVKFGDQTKRLLKSCTKEYKFKNELPKNILRQSVLDMFK